MIDTKPLHPICSDIAQYAVFGTPLVDMVKKLHDSSGDQEMFLLPCHAARSGVGMCLIIGGFLSTALAQFSGSRGGVEPSNRGTSVIAPLTREVAESYIAIDGKAEVRVKPTELRIVMAVTAEGETAQECRTTVDATLTQLKEAWAQQKISAEAIVVDFIAVLPRYEWKLEKQAGADVGIERKSGYRMQSNVHLAVADDVAAMTALGAAFEHGVTDVIAFDYWSRELDEVKERAREKAMAAARRKADVMLTLFDERPKVINVQEQTSVHYPDSLYHSFTNSVDEEAIPAFFRNQTLIRARRPRNTYYRGFSGDGDVQPGELPMKAEISVVSTVRIYYESPAANRPALRKPEK